MVKYFGLTATTGAWILRGFIMTAYMIGNGITAIPWASPQTASASGLSSSSASSNTVPQVLFGC